jgi:RNA polymerase sigma-70 factor (ECF subfamily)
MLRDGGLAEDLAQEAFARALGQSAEHPRAFLFAIATNLAYDAGRTAARRKHHLRLLALDYESNADKVVDSADRERQREAALQALERLSFRDREILLLWDAGFSYNEIARQTGLSLGAIGTTLARARRRLVAAYEALEK